MNQANTPSGINKSSDKPWLPTVTEFKLDSGLEGIFIDVPNAQSMLMDVSFRAGYCFCPQDKPELGHFLEHLVIKANKDYPSQAEFSQAVIAKGAYMNAYTDSYNVCYRFVAPDFDWQRVFGLMLGAVSQPLFLPEEFESEKAVIHQEHKMRLDKHMRTLVISVFKKIGFPTISLPDECLECLDSITIDDIRNHYIKTHTLENARVVIAGNLSPDRQGLIKESLEGWGLSAGGQRLSMPAERLSGAGLVYIEKTDIDVVHYLLAFSKEDLSLKPSDEIAMVLLKALWFAGKNSRIYGQARRQGLAYAMQGGLNLPATSTLFDFYGQVTPDNLGALIDLILFEIDRLLAEGLTDEEINRCKDYLRGNFQLGSFNPSSWANYYRDHYLDQGLVLPADYSSRLDSVDGETVIGLARSIFGSGDWTLGLLGNLPQETRDRIEAKLNQR